jgi:hypothetical protein
MEESGMSIRVLNPTADEAALATRAAPGLTSLEGRTVGLLDNSKINVRPLLDHMEEILRSRHGVKEVVRLKKPDPSRPAPPAVLAEMTGCDALISAVGD